MTFLELATTIAKKAGQYQLAQLHAPHHVEYKGDINLVTEVDKACEKMIVQAINQQYPDHDILGEEGMALRKQSDYRWIVDPLDGTTNYAHGYPLFCVSIALEHKGEIILGVVYEPNLDELFTAEKGQGSFLNGTRLVASKTSTVAKSLLSTGFAYNVREVPDNNFKNFEKFIFNAQAVRRDGVAAVDLCYVAAGRYDGFWELYLWPWDMAAGKLILEEAGGRVTRFDGSRFFVEDKEILATNGLIHDEMVRLLKG